MKYIKKPIPVEISEAWLKLGDHPNVEHLVSNICLHVKPANCVSCEKAVDEHGWISTLEGGHVVCPGDRIVTGIKGEQYPIKPDIFEQTYEPYDGQSHWQDKPDKEGWWWVKTTNAKLGVWVIEVEMKDNKLIIPTYIGMIGGAISYLYIPEPEPYKGEE